MAQHKVRKPFNHAEDGLNTRHVVEGETVNIHPDHVAGLVTAGYIHPEAASKIAGDAMVSADLAGSVDSDRAVKQEAAVAKAGISDGHIGAPEAASIIDDHKLTDLTDPVSVQAAEDEKKAHKKGDTDFDPKSPEAVAAAADKVEKSKKD